MCKNILKIIIRNIKKILEVGFNSRRGTPLASATSPRTPGSGGSLKIGRRSTERSKSPFRSFRWKRGSSRAVDFDDDDEGNKYSSEFPFQPKKTNEKST